MMTISMMTCPFSKVLCIGPLYTTYICLCFIYVMDYFNDEMPILKSTLHRAAVKKL
jgi:hypothetical protein